MILINGKTTTTITPSNRSLQFGDGVFETCIVQKGQIFLWEYHLRRLQQGLERLQINLDIALLEQDIAQFLANTTQQGLKIIISRGNSQQGYQMSNTPAERILYAFDVPYTQGTLSLGFCTSGYCNNPLLAGIKHQNRLEQILARKTGEDCIMLDMQNNVISTTSANIFYIKDNYIFTPDVSRCGIAGTRRAYILDNYDVTIKSITLEELLSADEVFISNATFGIKSVTHIKDTLFARTQTQQIRHTLCL